MIGPWFTVEELVEIAARAERCAALSSGVHQEYLTTLSTVAEANANLLRDTERRASDEEGVPGVREALSG